MQACVRNISRHDRRTWSWKMQTDKKGPCWPKIPKELRGSRESRRAWGQEARMWTSFQRAQKLWNPKAGQATWAGKQVKMEVINTEHGSPSWSAEDGTQSRWQKQARCGEAGVQPCCHHWQTAAALWLTLLSPTRLGRYSLEVFSTILV